MLPVPLDCPFLIAPLVFCNVYSTVTVPWQFRNVFHICFFDFDFVNSIDDILLVIVISSRSQSLAQANLHIACTELKLIRSNISGNKDMSMYFCCDT